MILALWLTIAATGAWAQTEASDSVADEVQLRDGSLVRAKRVPKRAPSEDYVYTYKGVKYTYITEHNYTRYFNTNVHKPSDYGWYPDDDGWYVNAEKDYITAASIDEESVPANAEVAILNDLVGFFKDHTHLGCVADHAFQGESKVKRIYFQDCDAMTYSSNTNPYFFIGHLAFANAPHLEKVDMMYYITSGDNRWEPMPVSAVKRIWDNMLQGSNNALLRASSSTLNDYKNSSVWAAVKNRFISYEPSGYEINEGGARYKCMLAEDGKTYLTNDGTMTDEVMKQLRLWNADYQSFNARQLMADDADATIYYTTIEGVDNDYLKSHDGKLRIYNDVGDYYNYKTLAIRNGAFSNCDDLKVVEFWQTNGRSENSYSNLKICIENSAFRDCKNLKEIRLYYYVQDGNDHWETLGPEDVVPGDDIFGWYAKWEDCEEYVDVDDIVYEDPQVRIVVSPTRYAEFLQDPNWAPYSKYIVAADYEPTDWSPLKEGGLTYDYVSKSLNTLSTDQIVDVTTSWWTAVYVAAEVIITVMTWGSGSSASSAAGAAAQKTIDKSSKIILQETAKVKVINEGLGAIAEATTNLSSAASKNLIKNATANTGKSVLDALFSQDLLRVARSCVSKVREGLKKLNIETLGNLLGTNKFTGSTQVNVKLLKEVNNVFQEAFKQRLADLTASIAEQQLVIKTTEQELAKAALRDMFRQGILKGMSGSTLASYMASRFSPAYQALHGEVPEDQMVDGMIDNMKSNIHQVGMVGLGFTTPDKKLIYHTYISHADPNQTDFTIYNDIGSAYNYRTVGITRKAFQGNTKVQREPQQQLRQLLAPGVRHPRLGLRRLHQPKDHRPALPDSQGRRDSPRSRELRAHRRQHLRRLRLHTAAHHRGRGPLSGLPRQRVVG
jgi:hypothetical protein